MASLDGVVLASFVTLVRGVMFYDFAVSAWGCWGDGVYDHNCIDVKCARGQPYMLGHLEAPVAALISPLMRDVSVDVSG